MTIGQVQRMLARQLAQAGIETASLDARLLVCAAAGLDHAGYVARENEPLAADAAVRLDSFAMRRLAREPVSRILGRRGFWGMEFTVTPDVLDPRPDTETLVETVLAALGTRRHESLFFVDLGTGSGAILAALLHEFPRASGLGIDRSEAAARVARANLYRLGFASRSLVSVGDWLGSVASADLIVSNPPYIESGGMGDLDPEVRAFDPAIALDGGPDGLAPYRSIARAALPALRPRGALVFEIGSGQALDVWDICRAAGFGDVTVHRDLGQHDRVILARP